MAKENNKSSGSGVGEEGTVVHISTWIQLVRLIGPCCQRHPTSYPPALMAPPARYPVILSMHSPETGKNQNPWQIFSCCAKGQYEYRVRRLVTRVQNLTDISPISFFSQKYLNLFSP